MIDYRLYLVTDDPSRYAGNWLDNVVAAVEGGVTCVQYRDTESASDERLVRARCLQDALKRTGTPLIINNDAELAAAVKAEGVHVGQRDLPPEKVRAIVGPACEIGLSITDISQLVQLADNPFVGCLGIGPVFDARKTKADASDAMGLAGLSAIISALHHHPTPPPPSPSAFDTETQSQRVVSERLLREQPPNHLRVFVPLCEKPSPDTPPPFHHPTPPPFHLSTVAIGGITLENAADVLATGVDGLAVVSAFSKSSDPFAVARAFRTAMAEGGR